MLFCLDYILDAFSVLSRLFERQADLYIFESSFDPFYMIQALDRLGVVTGFTHSQPSWHHFSLQERIDSFTKLSKSLLLFYTIIGV